MKWRKWNNILHRDIGYLCFGLTIVYAISGVAVNHIEDWNPSYTFERSEQNIGPVKGDAAVPDEMAVDILGRLGEQGEYLNSYLSDPETIQIFLEGRTITVNLRTGDVQKESVDGRLILREMNFLHLNHPKMLWSYFADLYAFSLAIVAITGLFVLKGRKGIAGRGLWLTATGIILPIIFLWLYL